tara:strand:- start:51258 stop:54167 length:2910 start_codon:yes stop_codon:yes gene_type:complete
MRSILSFTFLILISIVPLQAQETVNVTFQYEPNENALRAFVPGEFNMWGNNSSGFISPTDGSLMIKDEENGFWYKTIELQIGGGTATHNGKSGYAYKFHEQRNASGSEWEWFTDPLNEIAVGDNNDSFIEVTSPLIFQLGRNLGIADTNSDYWVTVASKDSDSIDVIASSIYLNDEFIGNFENNYEKERQLFFMKNIGNYNPVQGLNKLKIVAVTESEATTSDSLQFTFVGEPGYLDKVRPEGLKDGITYGEDGTSVSLSLFAPKKERAFVFGDFTDWKVELEYQMFRDSLNADSTWFWIEVEGLTAGEEYGFQYLIDGDLIIADPYSELLLDPFNDQYISESVFPNLKPYPEGKTTGLVGVLRPGKTPFEWSATNYNRPDKESLVIYELIIRDFIEDHSYATLIDTLDYLERLGVNAIELMPVNEFDGNTSWGYNPASHIALDKYYGSPEKFKEFVDESHKRGIAVILDVVLNHATGAHSLYKLYDLGSNPYFNTSPKHEFNVFNDFNHQYSGTQYYTKRMIEHWINEYKIDGFRWDLTKGFTQNCTGAANGCTGSYQQDRVDILKKYADYQWASDPNFYVIFEHLGGVQEESEWANYRINEGKGIMLWGNQNGAYNESTMGYVSNLSGVLSESKGFQKRHLVGYMESHDEQWLMFKNRSFGACENSPSGGDGCLTNPGSYNVRDLNTALDRQKIAGAFFFTLPGPKMLWQFGELGYGYGDDGEQCLNDSNDCPAFAPGRTDAKPIRWDYWNNPDSEERINLYKTWSALINLRGSSEAFTDPDLLTHSLNGEVKWIKMIHSDTDVAINGNFAVTSKFVDFTFPSTGVWYDFFTGESFDVGNGTISYNLLPGQFRIFTTKKFDAPEVGIVIPNENEDKIDTPTAFKLYQNYPNPFNPSTNITFDVAQTGSVSLAIYDMLGRKVSELVSNVKTAGTYSVYFDASGLSSGVYFARFQAGETVQIQKMTLLK